MLRSHVVIDRCFRNVFFAGLVLLSACQPITLRSGGSIEDETVCEEPKTEVELLTVVEKQQVQVYLPSRTNSFLAARKKVCAEQNTDPSDQIEALEQIFEQKPFAYRSRHATLLADATLKSCRLVQQPERFLASYFALRDTIPSANDNSKEEISRLFGFLSEMANEVEILKRKNRELRASVEKRMEAQQLEMQRKIEALTDIEREIDAR